MGTQTSQQKWYKKNEKADSGIKFAVTAVFEGEKNYITTERPVFVGRGERERQKVFLTAEDNEKYIVFSKLESDHPPYHEINFKFPKWARLGRESEKEPFDITSMDKQFGYCSLRIQPGCLFESVYIIIGREAYKVLVKEEANCIKVFLWANRKDVPKCLWRR